MKIDFYDIDKNLDRIKNISVNSNMDFEDLIIKSLKNGKKIKRDGFASPIYTVMALLIIFSAITVGNFFGAGDSSDKYYEYRSVYINCLAESYSYSNYDY